MNKIARTVALPLISAGIIGGAALGLAGTAAAAPTTNNVDSHSVVSHADGKAHDGQTMHTYTERHHSHNTFFRH